MARSTRRYDAGLRTSPPGPGHCSVGVLTRAFDVERLRRDGAGESCLIAGGTPYRGWGHHNAGGDTRATISLRLGQPGSASGFYLRSPIFPDNRRIVVGQILVPPIAFVGNSFQKGQALVESTGLSFLSLFRFKIGSHFQSAPLDGELPTAARLAKG